MLPLQTVQVSASCSEGTTPRGPLPLAQAISSCGSGAPTRESEGNTRRVLARRVSTRSIIGTNRHFEHFDIAPSFCLALNQLVKTFEGTGLDEAYCFPLCTYSILTFDLFHEA
jgi:hypothetical protein